MKENLELLLHIQEECLFIITQSKNLTEEEFYNDQTLKRAFIRSLEIIGEGSKKC